MRPECRGKNGFPTKKETILYQGGPTQPRRWIAHIKLIASVSRERKERLMRDVFKCFTKTLRTARSDMRRRLLHVFTNKRTGGRRHVCFIQNSIRLWMKSTTTNCGEGSDSIYLFLLSTLSLSLPRSFLSDRSPLIATVQCSYFFFYSLSFRLETTSDIYHFTHQRIQ